MPIMRNPFRSRPDQARDDSWPAGGGGGGGDGGRAASGNASFDSARPSASRRASSSQDQPPREYKLSEIDSRGVYMPPSPSETKSSFWSSRSGASTRTSSHRSELNENEPFSISRESFDSYRRSFDISARSPVLQSSSPVWGRSSVDARSLRLPAASLKSTAPSKKGVRTGVAEAAYPPATTSAPFQPRPNILPDNHVNPPTVEPDEPENPQGQAVAGEAEQGRKAATTATAATAAPSAEPTADHFEDVGLGEPAERASPAFRRQAQPQPSKRSSIFARFGGASIPEHSQTPAERPGSGHGLGLGMFGRKRGTSGQGAELGRVPGPAAET